MKFWRLAILLAMNGLVVACGDAGTEAVGGPRTPATIPSPPPPLDVGQIDRYLACSAKPRRELSPRERCEVEAFRSRCTALDDCYVSCISSPDGFQTGGRCAHVCTFGPHRGAPHPQGVAACGALPGRSGIDVESAHHGSDTTLTGRYEYRSDPQSMEMLGGLVCFHPDRESARRLPRPASDRNAWFCFRNDKQAKALLRLNDTTAGHECGVQGMAEVRVAGYTFAKPDSDDVDSALLLAASGVTVPEPLACG